MTRKQKKMLLRICICAALTAAFSFIKPGRYTEAAIYAALYLVIGYDIIIKAAKGIKNLQPFDENFLMTAAAVGAFALGEFREGVAVMLFYQTGELFQSLAVGKSRKNIAALTDICADTARVLNEDGTFTETDPSDVPVGTVVTVFPGERVPTDGVVLGDGASFDMSALTGESLPVKIPAGGEVMSGAVSISSAVNIKTTRTSEDSAAAKILELIESAGAKKSHPEKFISRFAAIYTPAVCAAALLLAAVPPLVLHFSGGDANVGEWVYRALTFLVISCPCALVISIPLSFFAAIGSSSSHGILIKGSDYIESMSKIKTFVFDKTGTVTRGIFEVAGVHHSVIEEERLIEYAALAESFSNHPISRSILKAYGKAPDRSRVKNVEELGGKGIKAETDGKKFILGNADFIRENGIDCDDCHCSGTVVHVACDGEYMGHILISDSVKPTAFTAIAALRKLGAGSIFMLTGDRKAAAEETASRLGFDGVRYELLPGDKVEAVETIMKEHPDTTLAFAGDGLNDAPVLALADVGFAMGALGADAAIEAADVVITDDDPLKIALAVKISKKCMRVVYENIAFSLSVKLICLLLGAFGYANMWFAVFADVGVMMIAVLNAIRLLKIKKDVKI